MKDEAYEVALGKELDRRIGLVSAYRDEDFGRIGGSEWAIFCLVGLLLPALLVWLAA